MSEQIMRDNLLVLAQAYADATGLALTTVSKRINGKHTFIDDFVAGRCSTSIGTYFAMIDKLRAAWPKGCAWPATREVPRLMRREVTDADRARRVRSMTRRGADGRFVRNAKTERGRARA